MNPANDSLSLIQSARDRMEALASEWDAASLPRTLRNLAELENSARVLETAQELIPALSRSDAGVLRPHLLAIRNLGDKLERLVGASSAFLRGLPGPDAALPPTYCPDGLLSERAAATVEIAA
jgi:hypothetical protein